MQKDCSGIGWVGREIAECPATSAPQPGIGPRGAGPRDTPGMELPEWLDQVVGNPRPRSSDHDTDRHGRDRVAESGRRELGEVVVRLREVGVRIVGHPELAGRLAAAGSRLPLALGNATVQNLNACEGLAMAAPDGRGVVTWEMFRGRALDSFVAHALHTGALAHPVEDLGSMWSAEERSEDLELLERFMADPLHESDLVDLASSAMSFGRCARWAPRAEVRIASVIEGALSLRGRVDVLFGGPGTDMPAAVVEVKSAGLHDSHFAQLRHYVMLAALRHGEMPAGAALWSPGTGLVPVPVTGSARSAAERVAVAADRLSELWLGGDAALTPGVHCRFCAIESTCPRAHDFEAPWDEDL